MGITDPRSSFERGRGLIVEGQFEVTQVQNGFN
jgi:hypothetical protein